MSRSAVSVRTLARLQARDHVVVTTVGEVDASNARTFADAVLAVVSDLRHVTLDLSRVTFMAVDGLSALYAINAHLMRSGIEWEVLPSPEVERMLAVCRADSLPSALPARERRERTVRHPVGRSA